MTEFKETLPKNGHVNEVCKEWLVREDGALAYQLQSKEINEFYQGNKYRNAVVRQDFPTALTEQMKEKENAEKQAALYYQWMNEQEQVDAQLAQKMTENLQKDFDNERLKQQHENEIIAKQLQKMYIETGIKPPPPPIDAISTQNFVYHTNSDKNKSFPQNSYSEMSNNDSIYHETDMVNENLKQFNQKRSAPQYTTNQNVFDKNLSLEMKTKYNNSTNQYHKYPLTTDTGEIQQYPDVTDSIRQYDLPIDDHRFTSIKNNASNEFYQHDNIKQNQLIRENHINIQQLSPEKYDYLMGNVLPIRNQIPNHIKTPLFEDPANFAQLGISPDEIQEINKRIEQEERDEKLARLLQEEEQKVQMTQEEKDRLLAIEAQDKELARMLQEREKAKAKRAKEKARLRKQHHKSSGEHEGNSNSNTILHNNHEPNSFTEKDAYANPIDFLPMPKNFNHHPDKMNDSMNIREFDLIGTRSMTNKEDEIYTLPIDVATANLNRPTTLDLLDTRNAENSFDSIDRSSCTTPGSFQHSTKPISCPLEESSSPVPPYMPIQGTRRNTSLDGKKKKSKDKCTHQ